MLVGADILLGQAQPNQPNQQHFPIASLAIAVSYGYALPPSVSQSSAPISCYYSIKAHVDGGARFLRGSAVGSVVVGDGEGQVMRDNPLPCTEP